ncbi:putative vomeronasal receptor-like protein 4 [Ochotona princeps]|uniref:putative vomeronasal receptor-like protein 4 n=1 Tax=Ochotona princeps TaxID=9978 RepID=UPI0027150AB5|nr:putative vomeronasal receptor-like protein 4 [Ochotona princeps]
MKWSSFIQKVIFLSLTGPGIGGNFFLFVKHVYMIVTAPGKKPTDLILIHLALSNTMTLCAKVISVTLPTFLLSNILGNIICKAIIYQNRVARSLSICTTCLLSVVQAITISPRNTWWRKLKPHTAWQVLPYLLLVWVFSLLISSNLLHYITAVNSMNGSNVGMYVVYCYMQPAPQMVRWLFLCLMALRDLIFQSLMGWSSVYMALYLYKHHRRVLYLQSSRCAKHPSPETRATRSTLLLMTFYWTDFIFSFYIGSTLTEDSVLLNIQMVVDLGYASLSPFVLINRDANLVNCWHIHWEAEIIFSMLTCPVMNSIIS